MYSLTTALNTIRRFPFQALAVICMVSLTFYLGYATSLMALTGEYILRYFERQPSVIAFFEIDATPQQMQSAQQSVQQLPGIVSAELVTKEQALERYQQTSNNDPLLLELVTADILPASLEVSTEKIEYLAQVKEKLDKQTGIEEVALPDDLTQSLEKWISTSRMVGTEILVVLTSMSFAVITTSIALKAMTQKKAIDIMSLLGASRAFIKGPFILEGMIYGFIGSAIGWLMVMARLIYVLDATYLFLLGIIPQPLPWELFAIQLSVGLALGVILGGLAGLLAANRLIKR